MGYERRVEMRASPVTKIRIFSPLSALAPWIVLAACNSCNGDTTQVVCQGQLADTDSGRKIESFVETWSALINVAGEIDRDMLNVCRSLAKDLALPSAAATLLPTTPGAHSPGAETQATCGRVQQEIDRIVRSTLVANARLAVLTTPVACAMDLDARLRCEAQCDSTLTGTSHLACAPGKAYGQCMDSCAGSCTGTCAGGCVGTCTGACAGTCAGNCDGRCDGTCASRNADGSCRGACTGNCTGTCDGTCTGRCASTCSGTCTTSCLGTCQGECATWFSPPLCAAPTGQTMVAECRINCDARSRFEAVCAEPAVAIADGVTVSSAQRNQLDRLTAALRNSYARFAKVGYRAATLIDSAAKGYAVALQGQLEVARQVGPGAEACVLGAIPLVRDAVTKINISVDAQTALAASASATGSLPPTP